MAFAARGVSAEGRARVKVLLALLAILFVLVALHRFFAAGGETAPAAVKIDILGRRVAMWKPAGPAPPDGYPVILFSHGFLGCNTQSAFLTAALAHAGYFVLAPDHHDAACGSGADSEKSFLSRLATTRSEQPFHHPEAWSDATYRDRRADLEAILDTILKEKSFQEVPIDSSRIGLAGHSLGGYTVLAMAGAWPSWKDERIKAVLGLSPYCTPFITKGDLAHLDVPVMYQGGTLDLGITPDVRRRGGAYGLSSTPKYYVELRGAGHLAWTNMNGLYHTRINEYSVAFFDRHLKGTSTADPLAGLLAPPWPRSVRNIQYALK
jgi:predicted dienelactone hydrolase